MMVSVRRERGKSECKIIRFHRVNHQINTGSMRHPRAWCSFKRVEFVTVISKLRLFGRICAEASLKTSTSILRVTTGLRGVTIVCCGHTGCHELNNTQLQHSQPGAVDVTTRSLVGSEQVPGVPSTIPVHCTTGLRYSMGTRPGIYYIVGFNKPP